MASFRQLSPLHIFARSSRADRAMPENQLRFGATETPAKRSQSQLGESRRRAALMFARTRARIEAAVPFPRVGVVRVSDALGNRPDMNVAVINVQAVMAGVWRVAAGEGGGGGFKRVLD